MAVDGTHEEKLPHRHGRRDLPRESFDRRCGGICRGDGDDGHALSVPNEQLRADGEIEDGETDGDWGDDFTNYSWRQSIAPTDIKGLHDITLTIENPKTGKQLYELRTMLFEPPLIQEEDTSKTSPSKKKKRKGADE